MAEIAGSIVGIISLSIQLYDKLNKYANGVKDAKDKAEQITAELDRFSDLLEELEVMISNLDPTARVNSTRIGITACADAIDKVKEKLHGKAPSGGSKTPIKLKSLLKRLSFPFRESDINYWKDTLNSIQISLLTALNALGIDQFRRDHESLREQIRHQSLLNQSTIQSVVYTQQINHQSTSSQISEHMNMTQRSSDQTSQKLDQLQGDISKLQGNLSLVALNSTRQSKDEMILASLSRMEAKFNILTLESVSPAEIDADRTDLQKIGRNIQRTSGRHPKGTRKNISCTCRGQTTVTKLLQWPFSVVRARTSSHERQCPFWLPDDVSSTIDVKFSICSLLLGRKMRVALALLHEGGGYSVQPSLICHRVVKTSPAFEYIFSLPMDDDWDGESAYKTLYRMFQAGEASPYDRLPSGLTLLHAICNEGVVWGPVKRNFEWNYLLAHMLPVCDKVASERDKHGLTAFDIAFTRRGDYTILTMMLNHGIQLSGLITNHPCYSIDSVLKINFKNFDDPFDGLDKITESVLYRSEEDLERSLLEAADDNLGDVPFHYLLELSARSGWVEGCAKLVLAGAFANIKKGKIYRLQQLLFHAVHSGNVQMVRFWLNIRDNVDHKTLHMIGTPQSALKLAYMLYGDSEMFQAILDYIIHWRLQLRHLAESKSIELHDDETKTLFDFNAEYVVELLTKNGNSLPLPMYFLQLNGVDDFLYGMPIGYLDSIYKAGFAGIFTSYEICESEQCSTFMALMTHYIDYFDDDNGHTHWTEYLSWFKGKKIDFSTKWPGSTTNIFHCIGWKCASELVNSRRCPRMLKMSVSEYGSSFVKDERDACICGCSKSGCVAFTCFWKECFGVRYTGFQEGTTTIYENWTYGFWGGLTESYFKNFGGFTGFMLFFPYQLFKILGCRWIITESIRLVLFSILGLRHTCCDINKIRHRGYPDLEKQPYPRYTAKETRRIKHEDAHLLSLLESLVERFDAEYDAFDGDFYSFIFDHLIPEMKKVLRKEKQMDKDLHGEARRNMGVVMEEQGNDAEESAASDYESSEEWVTEDEKEDEEENGYDQMV